MESAGNQVVSNWTQIGGVNQPAFRFANSPAPGAPGPEGLVTPPWAYALPAAGSLQPRTPLFTWHRVPGASLYYVVVARDAGFTHLDAWTPYPVHGMITAIGRVRSWLPLYTLAGGLTGLFLAGLMQFYLSAYYYPIIVGGKEYRSWEAFTPIFFEMTVLFAGFFTLFSLIGLCGLPRLFHPVDQHPTFSRSTRGGFLVTWYVR